LGTIISKLKVTNSTPCYYFYLILIMDNKDATDDSLSTGKRKGKKTLNYGFG
jgi:hypothetical protein